MANQAKVYAVEDLVEKIKSAKSAALVDYQGLTAEQTAELRKGVKEAGGNIEVAKNTLLSRALAAIGIKLEKTLEGPTALVTANEDEIAPLKVVDETRKKLEKPQFKLGVYEEKLLSMEDLTKFVDLPSKEVLLAQFVGGLANPLSRLVLGLKFNQTKLALLLKALVEKKEKEN